MWWIVGAPAPKPLADCPRSADVGLAVMMQESELTPSGANLLDGRYAVFGYVVEGQDLLTQLQVPLTPAVDISF